MDCVEEFVLEVVQATMFLADQLNGLRDATTNPERASRITAICPNIESLSNKNREVCHTLMEEYEDAPPKRKAEFLWRKRWGV